MNSKSLWLLVIGFPLLGLVWGGILSCSHTHLTPESLNSLFGGWGIVALLATLIHYGEEAKNAHAVSAAESHLSSEVFYLQAISAQMSALGTLVEHAREDVMCSDFKKRLITLANEFELAKHRAAGRLGINLP